MHVFTMYWLRVIVGEILIHFIPGKMFNESFVRGGIIIREAASAVRKKATYLLLRLHSDFDE